MTKRLNDRIDELPEDVRAYIHDLETRADPAGDVMTAHAAKENLAGVAAMLRAVTTERDEARDALVDGFVPVESRDECRQFPLARVVQHALDHHEWHHEAADVEYVRGVETEREEAQRSLSSMREAETVQVRFLRRKAEKWQRIAEEHGFKRKSLTGDIDG